MDKDNHHGTDSIEQIENNACFRLTGNISFLLLSLDFSFRIVSIPVSNVPFCTLYVDYQLDIRFNSANIVIDIVCAIYSIFASIDK